MSTFYMCKKLLQQMFPIEKQLWNKNSPAFLLSPVPFLTSLNFLMQQSTYLSI